MDIEYEISIERFRLKCIQIRAINAKHCVEQKVVKVVNNKYYYEGKEIFKMTPQEEMFMRLFNSKVELVKDMDVLQLRAHREKLAETIKDAKVSIQATDKVISEKTKKDKGQGFQTSLTIDEASTDAINTIKERQKKLTKMEKVMEGLIAMGIDPKDAQSMTSNSAIADQRAKKDGVKPFVPTPIAHVDDAPAIVEEKKPFSNPFAKKIGE